MNEIRVLLAEDHNLVRAGIHALIDTFDDITVVGEASDGREATRLARSARPDVVLMDIAMPGLNGLEATSRIVRSCPRTRVLVL
ncbi:MAG: response regulator transcription factor, partial [Chromatiales bacterium]|nr:response regulator transcription factor [Chromatiales bacterium]